MSAPAFPQLHSRSSAFIRGCFFLGEHLGAGGHLAICNIAWYYHGMTETVSFKMSRALLLRIDGAAPNRSDFIRDAITEKLERFHKRNKSAWDALAGVSTLDIRITAARGKVRRVRL